MKLIVCSNGQGIIGKELDLLYNFSSDMKRFKQLTSDSTDGIPHIVMGRKTFDSIGKPLPNRRNIVISRNVKDIPGCEVMELDEFISKYKDHSNLWVLGGAEMYKELIDYCEEVYLTTVIDNSYYDDSYINIIEVLDNIDKNFECKHTVEYFQELDKKSNNTFILAFKNYVRK